MSRAPRIGVLALQGAFAAHSHRLASLGAEPVEIRRPDHLDGVDALVMPGGESTTMSLMLDRSELREPIAALLDSDLPTFGTCAGMILLAEKVLDGRADQQSFGAIDIDVRRNGYGRQVDSFDQDLDLDPAVSAGDGPFDASFIRAPIVERVGPDVSVLATVDDLPVLCRSGSVLVAAFHPELSTDLRIHRYFLEEVH